MRGEGEGYSSFTIIIYDVHVRVCITSAPVVQGDLGTIDEKYDVAISTACGALDSIIVDTMDTAVCCVDFLRKQDVGVATFIGLDKMERWKREAHSKIKT